jgi:hypothetical protein
VIRNPISTGVNKKGSPEAALSAVADRAAYFVVALLDAPPDVLLAAAPLSSALALARLDFFTFFLPLALPLGAAVSVVAVAEPVVAEPPVVAVPPVVAAALEPVAPVVALAAGLLDGLAGVAGVAGVAFIASPFDGAVVVCAAAMPAVAANAAAITAVSTLFMDRSS